MFYVAATIYNSTPRRPRRCHKWSPHRKTAPGTPSFVPTGQEARKEHSLKVHGVPVPLSHPPFRASGVSGLPRRHTEKPALPK